VLWNKIFQGKAVKFLFLQWLYTGYEEKISNRWISRNYQPSFL